RPPCSTLFPYTTLFRSSLDTATNSLMNQQFMHREIRKTYHAIVRGYTPNEATIDYPLVREDGKEQDAITHFKTLSQSEIDIPSRSEEHTSELQSRENLV